ncbi:MAG: MarC family protein [Verrucomicrobiota bacterium]
MSLAEYTLLALSSLFVILDPIATVPAFLAMTVDDPPEARVRMAKTACLVASGLLLVFAVVGNALFRVLGVTIPAFQMAGSLVLMLVALDMVRAQRSPVQETQEEKAAGVLKDDIAVTPLAVPMLAGPGAISTVILLHTKADSLPKHVMLLGAIIVVGALSYGIFALSARGARWLSPIALRVTERIMGLLLAAIAFQFFINALRDLGWLGKPAP